MGYKLSLLSEQSFPHLLDGIEDQTQWHIKRSSIEATWREYLGWMPERIPVKFNVHAEHVEADHIRVHLSYETGYGDQVYAYLLIPEQAVNPRLQQFPAMLALHPTHKDGKADIASSEGRANRQYGLELVSRGYVVLAPDTITAGERIYAGYEAFL
jgi:hypothetical protein